MAGHQVTTIGATLRLIGTPPKRIAEYFPLIDKVVGDAVNEVRWTREQMREFISDIGFWLEEAGDLRRRSGLPDSPPESMGLDQTADENDIQVSIRNSSLNLWAKWDKVDESFRFRSQGPYDSPWSNIRAWAMAMQQAFGSL